jgi:hypothetical protein
VLVILNYPTRLAVAQPAGDPWCGTYVKLGDQAILSPDGRVPHVAITRDADGYRLSKPYDGDTFIEVEKGVLQDSNKILGRIYLGSVQFAGGSRKSATVLRAEVCYEAFLLCR